MTRSDPTISRRVALDGAPWEAEQAVVFGVYLGLRYTVACVVVQSATYEHGRGEYVRGPSRRRRVEVPTDGGTPTGKAAGHDAEGAAVSRS